MNTEWINTMAALIAALGSLLVGIGTVWPQLRRMTRKRTEAGSPTLNRALLFAGIPLLAFSGIVFTVQWFSEANSPLSERLTTRAWGALNRGDYRKAISSADDCITLFKSLGDE